MALATFAPVELEVCERVALPVLEVAEERVSLELVLTEALESLGTALWTKVDLVRIGLGAGLVIAADLVRTDLEAVLKVDLGLGL